MKAKISRYSKFGGRKIKIELDNFDTWDVDSTLSHIILPVLLQLKDTMHGIPNGFILDIPGDKNGSNQYSFDFVQEDYHEVFDKCCDKWKDTLDKMIWSFQQLAIIDIDDLYMKSKRKDPSEERTWYDFKGEQLHNERIQEGLDLFSKYYRDLWD